MTEETPEKVLTQAEQLDLQLEENCKANIARIKKFTDNAECKDGSHFKIEKVERNANKDIVALKGAVWPADKDGKVDKAAIPTACWWSVVGNCQLANSVAWDLIESIPY